MGRAIDPHSLKEAIDTARGRGEKIVFTNGCFDILHVGHVRYLNAAKELGDLLVVGLNSDRSVAALKTGRPVNPQAFRAEVLSSLAAVDYVTVFDEDTPYALISLLRPDVLVKGGDWKREDVVGADIVEETHILPYVKGVSTSLILEKIRNIPEGE